jgi:hypothetical protein
MEAVASVLPFGGPSGMDCRAYHAVLAAIHRRLMPRSYLEVGVDDGSSLEDVLPTTRCVGVDPAPRCDGSVHPHLVMVEQTSDDYFRTQRPEDLVGRGHYDLVFIDGMHLFEFALRDFANAERQCSRTSVILAHDCVPFDARTSTRKRETGFWSGDVWKLIPALRKYRPDLTIDVIDVAPTGLAVIRGLDPRSETLAAEMPRILAEFLPLSFDAYVKKNATAEDVLGRLHLSALQTVLRRAYHFKAETVGGTSRRRVGPAAPQGALATCREAPCSKEPRRPDPAALSRQNPAPLPAAKRSTAPRMLGVLVCHDEADILPDAIESLLESNHHLVVWDRGTTGETASVLDRYAEQLVERTLVPGGLELGELHATISKHLVQKHVARYDWISWPGADELLEGPDRSRSYAEHVAQLLEEGHDGARFDEFDYWFSPFRDDAAIASPARRLRHYCLFPEGSPRLRGWRASATKGGPLDAGSLPGKLSPRSFRLRRYPARSYEEAVRRFLADQKDPGRGSASAKGARRLALDGVMIDARALHFDDGVSELHPAVTFDWKSIYR